MKDELTVREAQTPYSPAYRAIADSHRKLFDILQKQYQGKLLTFIESLGGTPDTVEARRSMVRDILSDGVQMWYKMLNSVPQSIDEYKRNTGADKKVAIRWCDKYFENLNNWEI